MTGLSILFGFLLLFPLAPAYGFFQGLSELGKEPLSAEKILQKLEQATGKTAPSFKDVKKDAWFHSYVSAVAEWGIVSGYKNSEGALTGEYGPSDPLSIGAILKMTLRAAKVNEMTCAGSPAHPQAKEHWARQFVLCGEERDFRILRNKKRSLDEPAKRGEVAGILFDAFGSAVPLGQASFSDTGGHAYEADIAYAASLGIVSGDDGKNTFRPNDGVNRAEAAKMIYNRIVLEATKK
ncbi:hypothetical protein A3D11_03255 [Candidatus Peribacteria bacterium RIFCSPHIGHO2_02_FULL_49_16]|nr:MAG: hypothetical protein A3D11_03255 [Candidatus Peribacteria bacterium RIFCSPHIGHO2_02_FULL_49_16]